MNNFEKLYRKIAALAAIKVLTSVRIVVVCLVLLFILTLWGTIYQVENGLYPAQEKFFHSLFFLIFNVIPFPGARLVMWALFVNLVVVLLFRFVYSVKRIGILIIHFGIMLFLFSGFMTYHYAAESHLTLAENEASNVSASYHSWELAAWKEEGEKHRVVAFDVKNLSNGKVLPVNEYGFDMIVHAFYPHCKAFSGGSDPVIGKVLNASGIELLKEEKASLDPEKNIPGLIIGIAQNDRVNQKILLYGGELDATPVDLNGETYHFSLRHKRTPIPFLLKLVDFRMQKHPGTEVARSFESTVEITTPELSRQTVISMNNPLRYKDFTLYQASYAIDPVRGEISTLAVVKNSGRVLPYIASFVTFLGLLVHFVTDAFAGRKRKLMKI